MAMKKTGPSLRARLLGQELAKARNDAKLTMDQAAEYLQVDQSKISRMEAAIYPAQKAYVLALLDFYNVSDETRRHRMLKLARDVWRKDWWDNYRGDIDRQFVDYPWLESKSEAIRSYETSVLSGLMQTRTYAATIIQRAEPGIGSDQLDRLVELRMKRQDILTDGTGKPVSAVIDEAVLRRMTGGTATMRAQLQHLANLAKLPNLEVQVLPTAVDCQPVFGGPFTLFEMPDPYPDVAYAENLAGRAYIEESTDVERTWTAYDELRRAALTPAKSLRLIKSAAKDLQ